MSDIIVDVNKPFKRRALEAEVLTLKDRKSMCEETIRAKDKAIIALSELLEKTTPTSANSPLGEDILAESFHESVKVSILLCPLLPFFVYVLMWRRSSLHD